MKAILLVGLGGLLGSVARYKAGLVEKHDFFAAETRLFLFTGLLGGFTTFSAFGLDTLYLLRRGELMTAASSWPHHA